MMKLLYIFLIALLGVSFLQVGNGMALTSGKLCGPMAAVNQLQPPMVADHQCCCCGKERGEQQQSNCELKARCADTRASSPLPASSGQAEVTLFAPRPVTLYAPPSSTRQVTPRAAFARETTYLVNLNILC